MKIESLTNSKVIEWNKLKEKKYRDQLNLFLIEGDHLMEEALKQGVVKEILASDITFQKNNIPFYEVTPMILKKLSKQVSGTNVICVCEKPKEREIKGPVCLLDTIQDPGNLGTIIRSAVAFNMDTLILSTDTVDVYNEKVIRSSEGMLFSLNIIRRDLLKSIKELKEKGYTIYGTNVAKGKAVKSLTIPKSFGIIIGNEGRGVDKNLLKECDECLYIPISSTCESLNAGVAASIIFYELNR